MTAKFGFQITVQERTLWIFPEDINVAEGVAKAEAAVKAAVQDEIEKLRTEDTETLKALFDKLFKELPTEIKGEIQNEIDRLKKQAQKEADKVKEAAKGEAKAAGVTLTDEDFTAIALKNKASLIEAQLTEVTGFAAEAKAKIESLRQKLNQGITYGWTRGPGEDPISLGTFDDLLDFIDDKIIASLPELIRPDFDVSDSFDALVSGLPEPVNGAVEALKSGAIFELDGLRFKIPGKNKKSDEKMQFEIAMLINLVPLDLILGPFQLNRLYSKLGNFGETTAALPPSA